MKSVITYAALGLFAAVSIHFVIVPVVLQVKHVLLAVAATLGG